MTRSVGDRAADCWIAIGRGVAWAIRAGEQRRSRFHDYGNRRLPPSAIIDLPLVLWQSALRTTLDHRPVAPWIPYPAIRRLEQIIKPHWRVLETGSGNSTLWLASRVCHLRSVESDEEWYRRIRALLTTQALQVDYEYVDLKTSPNRYWSLRPGEEASYDLVIVDGFFRKECTESAIRAVRRDGYIYLDNIDTSGVAAFQVLCDAVAARGGSMELFTGFPPAQPSVTTGALVRLPMVPLPSPLLPTISEVKACR